MKIIRAFLVIIVVYGLFLNTPHVKADELSDLNKKLQEAQKQRDEILGRIQTLENDINNISSSTQSLASRLSILNEQNTQLNEEIIKLNNQIDSQSSLIVEIEEILLEKKNELEQMTNYVHKFSFLIPNPLISSNTSLEEIKAKQVQADATMLILEKSVRDYEIQYDNLITAKKNNEIAVNIAVATKTVLDNEIVSIKNQIASLNEQTALLGANYNELAARADYLSQQIDLLSEEQKMILEREREIISNNPSNGGSLPINENELFFSGTGRDIYQGHGLGLSQFGAHGAGLSGYRYDQILSTYYNGTTLGELPEIIISVQDVGDLSINDYISGLGEVPDKACGTQSDIDKWDNFADEQNWPDEDPRRNKFAIDNPNTIWDCWPEEAIKAQVVAGRTYAYYWYTTRGVPICTTAACQVYDSYGPQDKAWASYETRNKYVLYEGEVINALYSSDNSQGFGTANRDTIWSDYNGNNTTIPYLTWVNDSAFATPTYWGTWNWRTNGYRMADLQNMLNHGKDYCSWILGGGNKCVSDTLDTVGQINAIQLNKDNSNRVKSITIQGDKGTDQIAGWLFKALWNDWTYQECEISKSKPQCDYIFSLTFNQL